MDFHTFLACVSNSRQAEIRWRLRSVYDRQEVTEVLGHLQTEGYLSLRKPNNASGESWDGAPLDDREETRAFWFLGERCWFSV
jgi:transcription factor C subunit 3